MASNPPIAGLPANGSFSLQARIDRFLTTIGPHLQYFTKQGRSYLDSTLERDKTERRYLNHDKTGWASVPLGGTSVVDARGDPGDISRGSEDSVNPMSSVSQRGGRLARMRDRNGNTAASIWIGEISKKQGALNTKKGALVTPIEVESSSSPIQPWKDIEPKNPIARSTASSSLPSPGLFPAVDPLDKAMIPFRSIKPAHANVASVTARKETIVTSVDDRSSRKRKHDIDDGGKQHGSLDKSKRHRHRDNSPNMQIVSDTGEEQRSKAKSTIPDLKGGKRHQQLAVAGAVVSNLKVSPRRQTRTEIVEKRPTVLLDPYGKTPNQGPKTLREAASKSNLPTSIREKKKTEAKANISAGETSKKKTSSKNVVASPTAEEKARDEILTARRTRRREKMNLKTTSAPISKRNGIKAADQESCSDHEDSEYATRAKTSLKKKTTNRRGNIGTALLQAYDNSGNMDRSHRITLPKTSLRLGIFGKGMSGRQGGTTRGVKHPPDLQFQSESFMKRKEKQPNICSSDSTSTNGSHTSVTPDRQIRKRVMIPLKKGKREQQPVGNKGRKHKAASETPQLEREFHQTSKERRQTSPDWPSVLPSSDSAQGVEKADKIEDSASLTRSEGITKRFPASESGQKSRDRSSNRDDLLSPHPRSASVPVMIDAPAVTKTSRPSGRSPILQSGLHLDRQSLNTQPPMEESRLSSQSPPLGDLSYDSILAKALAEASCPSVIAQVSSSALGSLLNAYIKYGSDEESAADFQDETGEDWGDGQGWQARDVEGYESECEHSQILADEFDQEILDDTAGATCHEAMCQTIVSNVPPASDPVGANGQDDLLEGKIAGDVSVDFIGQDGEGELGGTEGLQALEESEYLDHWRRDQHPTHSSDYSNQIDALDVFGTDAEHTRKVLYGTGFHR